MIKRANEERTQINVDAELVASMVGIFTTLFYTFGYIHTKHILDIL